MSNNLSFKDFQLRLGQDFQIEQESKKWIAAKLIEATELKIRHSESDEQDRTPFVIVLQAGSDVNLSQKTYSVKHDELGEHQIFLVPIQPNEQGTLLEAIFT